jgi:DNA-binding PadR family transcriptional regulator
MKPSKLYGLSDEGRERLIEFLDEELNETGYTSTVLRCSIETLLEALGAEGHDFT